MRRGHLSEFFRGVGAKTLRGTEVDPDVSRGHEFQGVQDFQTFLGTPSGRERIPMSYVWLSDDEPPLRIDLEGTWYDSRKRQTRREPEPRLYYPKKAEDVVRRAKAGDTLFLCLPQEGRPLLALLCKTGSSIEQQLLWLFGLALTDDYSLSQRDLGSDGGRELTFAARYVLDLIGIEAIVTEDTWLDELVRAFGGTFPATTLFSSFARKRSRAVDPLTDPDAALLEWIEFEERLFLTFERHLISERLSQGFMNAGVADVDSFIRYSLGVQNRRKSRAGYALGHHTEAILTAHSVTFQREAFTEKRNGPDFLFPGQREYHDQSFPETRLTMLAAKTSCKDRWRQVLAEAARIERKHLLTLEPGISVTQTEEMDRSGLQLVVPRGLHGTYRNGQRSGMLDVASFIGLVRDRQGVHSVGGGTAGR